MAEKISTNIVDKEVEDKIRLSFCCSMWRLFGNRSLFALECKDPMVFTELLNF